VWAEYQARRAEHGYDPAAVAAAGAHGDRLGAKVVQAGSFGIRGAIGTPDQLRDYLRRYEECGVDQLIFCAQAGKNRHEDIMESLELFGTEVLPEFADRHEAAAAAKASRLEPVIEAALARKPPSDHPPLPRPDYAFPAIPRGLADREGNDAFHQWLDELRAKMATGEQPEEFRQLLG
jgi:hypothetical protein